MPSCEIGDHVQMSKRIIAVRHFRLGGRESLETAVKECTFILIVNCFNTEFDVSSVEEDIEKNKVSEVFIMCIHQLYDNRLA